MSDFIPKTDAPLLNWLRELKKGLPDHVADFEVTPERAAAAGDWIDGLTAAMDLAAQKRNEWLAASSAKKLQKRASLAGLRQEIARWKTAPGAKNGGVAALKLTASVPAVDGKMVQPELSAQGAAGHVVLKFKKRGASDVNLYVRHAGDATFRLLARVTRSPYHDHTPVARPGTAEAREYQAVGVLHDREIGQPSAIVSMTLAG